MGQSKNPEIIIRSKYPSNLNYLSVLEMLVELERPAVPCPRPQWLTSVLAVLHVSGDRPPIQTSQVYPYI